MALVTRPRAPVPVSGPSTRVVETCKSTAVVATYLPTGVTSDPAGGPRVTVFLCLRTAKDT